MMRVLGLTVGTTLAAACSFELPERTCELASECVRDGVPGECVPSPASTSSWCAFPSGACTSGLEFGSLAGDGLAGECIASGGGVDADVPDANPDACVAATEVCDGIDNDCNGSTDEGCPDVVQARFPWNGYATGSVWATAVTLVVKPRRPSFIWEPVTGATSYRLQVDDSCTTPNFATCDFASPELEITVTGTTATAAADLPVATTPPVGRRYYWRVQACNEVGCGIRSAVRYLDVGRMANDFNGDGYGDVAAGAPFRDVPGLVAGAAYVCFGSTLPPLDCVPNLTLTGATGDRLGAGVAAAGDVNADGFADLLVAADRNSMDTGRVYLYFGGPVFSASPDVTFTGEGIDNYFGWNVIGPGDLNGDGYRDIAISAPSYDIPLTGDNRGRVYVFFGDSGVSIDATAEAAITGDAAADGLGDGLAEAGDVDGDGFCDLLIGAPASNGDGGSGSRGGRAYLYRGGAGSSFDTASDFTVAGVAGAELGNSVGGCDVNRDGFADILVGANLWENNGRFFIYNGGPTFDTTADTTITASHPDERFGVAVACTDMNADGYADIVVGAMAYDSNRGRAAVYFGNAGSTVDLLTNGVFTGQVAGDYFGVTVAAAGDVTGDGYGDVIIGAPFDDAGGPGTDNRGRAYLFSGGAGASAEVTADMRITGVSAGDWCGTAVAGAAF